MFNSGFKPIFILSQSLSGIAKALTIIQRDKATSVHVHVHATVNNLRSHP